MDLNKVVAIIPARYASVRFPGKPLAMIGDKNMIRRVYDQVIKAIPNVVVATDDERILNDMKQYAAKAVMTSDSHKSGTDRCWEAYTKLHKKYDVILNVQGDEPFIQPSQLEALIQCFDNPETEIATLVRRITPEDGVDYLLNPNHPKVVINKNNEARYFSRSVIPYLRNVSLKDYIYKHDFYSHIGVYAYRPQILKEIVKLEPSSLEMAESLEQLRWLENGYKINVAFTTLRTFGIDTPDDLKELAKFL
jgi:3-deoxy-manno-octulosonate cytidylyltransferase (CMP-KDO synthetase)